MRLQLSLLCLSIFIPACGMEDFTFGTPVAISSFTASPERVNYGEQTTLRWVLDGTPTSLTLDDNSVIGKGAVLVRPARRQTFVLTASTPLGGDTKAVTVGAAGVDLLAGSIGGAGTVDGAGGDARFNNPGAIANARFGGNIFVADTLNHTVRKISPQGVVTTLAGLAGISGSADGTGASARFNSPRGIGVDATGYVYVADSDNHTIRKITFDGVVTTLAGSPGVPGSTDGTGASARFAWPHGLAVDVTGNVYVADTSNSTIRKITYNGVVTTVAGSPGMPGATDGTGSSARFEYPLSLALDGEGNIYVPDSSGTGQSSIRKITQSGEVSTLLRDLSISSTGIAVDDFTNIYLVSYTAILKVTGQVVSYLAGSNQLTGSADGTGGAARFASPLGITFDGWGDLYVADSLNCTIRKVSTAGVVSTLAGLAGYGDIDGTGSDARFSNPRGIALDSSGNAYVTNEEPSRIRKVTPAGVVTTFVSSAGLGGLRLWRPLGIAIDGSGNVYVADAGNNSIQKFGSDGAVETLAGSLIGGSDDGIRTAAHFRNPSGVAVASSGNLYVADTSNHTIRVVTPTGVVSTLVGLAGASGSANGTGAAARFNSPYGIAIDDLNNIYVADTYNHTIRVVTSAGVVTTLAGSPGLPGSDDGRGAAARFNYPYSVAVSSTGYVYVADTYNHTIRSVTLDGVVRTIGGVVGSGGALPGRLPGRLAFPYGIALTRAGDLVVTNPAGVMQLTF